MTLIRLLRIMQRSSLTPGTSPPTRGHPKTRGEMKTEHGSKLGKMVQNRQLFAAMETKE